VNHSPQEPGPFSPPAGPSTVRKFFRGPGLVVAAVAAVIVVWFAISFLTPEPVHKDNPGSINYNGVAEVMDIAETQTKCFVHIKRDTGKETKQSMRKADCRKVRVGDMINIENGQYVSTASSGAR
jgi:hypothetical protein